ncbi:type II toxin-antitoxin system YafQ family toxin [Desulfosarcina sp. OttesenSCG-928-A07]|nr:type II toxin-antitoxin system YafQ family toxin [Desulfosarcina sp. OttesenSCG-928-G17]MDL2328379.1 type II toxin-antitoxin system YafQ family toxin [Desulfosarcina sp. OttesenSCG-928-A07]
MRTTEREMTWTSAFKRDFKREKKTDRQLEDILGPALSALIKDIPLAAKYRDHALTGDWQPNRDCHIKPDLVLVYQKPDEDTLLLVRLGSHAELGL